MIHALLQFAAASDCAAPTTLAQVDASLVQAEKAFVDLDVEGGFAASDTARAQLACLGEPLRPTLAAHFYRVEGVRAVEERRDDDAARHFSSARNLEPKATLAVSGGKLDELYLRRDPATELRGAVPTPTEGSLTLDGRPKLERGLDLYVIAQYVDVQGEVAWTAFVAPGQALPAYPASDAPVVATGEAPAPKEPKAKASFSVPLLAVGGVAVAGAGGAYFVARQQYLEVTDPETGELLSGQTDRAEELRGLNHALVVGSAVLAAGGGACLVLAF